MKAANGTPLMLGAATAAGTVGLLGGGAFVVAPGSLGGARTQVLNHGSVEHRSSTGAASRSRAWAAGASVAAAVALKVGLSRRPAKCLRAVPAVATSEAAPMVSPKHWTKEIGATLPLCEPKEGMTRWDPAGLSSGKNAHKFDTYRAAEVKHGRIAMIAVVGLVAQHYFRFKGIVGQEVYSLEDVPAGFGAITTYPSSVGFAIIVLIAGIIETGVLSDEGQKPGYFGDPLGLRKNIAYADFDNELETMEIEHGRLAMFGVIGTLWAEYVTGYDAVEQWEHATEGGGRLLNLLFSDPGR